MKQFCVALFFLVGVLASPLHVQRAEPGMIITAPDGFAIACESTFSRILPHYCIKDTLPLASALTVDSTCHDLGLALPSNVRLIQTVLIAQGLSSGAIASRTALLEIFSDVACTSLVQQYLFQWREEVLLAAGGLLYSDNVDTQIRFFGGHVYYKITTTDTINLLYILSGYYD